MEETRTRYRSDLRPAPRTTSRATRKSGTFRKQLIASIIAATVLMGVMYSQADGAPRLRNNLRYHLEHTIDYEALLSQIGAIYVILFRHNGDVNAY